MKIAIAGTGYVGLSLTVLLSQHNDVTAVDIDSEKVKLISEWKSPVKDEYIEKYQEREKIATGYGSPCAFWNLKQAPFLIFM